MAHKPVNQLSDQRVQQAILGDVRAKQQQDTITLIFWLVLAGGDSNALKCLVKKQVEGLAEATANEVGSRRPAITLDVDEKDAAV